MDYKERISKALSISTDTKLFEMGKCASEKAPAIFKRCFPGRKAVILADKNTWAALGEQVFRLFKATDIQIEKYIIEKDEFHAEWQYVEMADLVIEGKYDEAKVVEKDGNHKESDAE